MYQEYVEPIYKIFGLSVKIAILTGSCPMHPWVRYPHYFQGRGSRPHCLCLEPSSLWHVIKYEAIIWKQIDTEQANTRALEHLNCCTSKVAELCYIIRNITHLPLG